MSHTPCPPVTTHVKHVVVTVDPAGQPQFSEDPIVVDTADTLLVFDLQAPDYLYPDDGTAVQVAGTDAPTKKNVAEQFPMAWRVNETIVALQDRNADKPGSRSHYACTVTVQHRSSGAKASRDPGIENNGHK